MAAAEEGASLSRMEARTCSLSGNFSFLGGPLLLPSQTSCSSPPEVKMLILNAPRRGLLGVVAVSTPGNEEAKKSRYSFAILLNFCQELQCSMMILTSVLLFSLLLLLTSLLLLLLDLLFFTTGSELPLSPATCPSSPPFLTPDLFRSPTMMGGSATTLLRSVFKLFK